MENNNLEKIIIDLFTSLSFPYIENPNEITYQLMHIFSSQPINAISLLFKIYHTNPAIRKQSLIGIRICIKNMNVQDSQLTEELIQQIWNQILQIIKIEPNDELMNFIINPAIELFNKSKFYGEDVFGKFGLLIFFQRLANDNFPRCIRVFSSFVPESIDFEKNLSDFLCNLLSLSFQYPQKNEIINPIVVISYNLLSNEQIDEGIKDDISNNLSKIFVELLSNLDKNKINSIMLFHYLLRFGIQPFKTEIILNPIIQTIKDNRNDIYFRCELMDLLASVLNLDKTKISIEDVYELFNLSIFLSVMAFDTSYNQEDPDSVLTEYLLSECLERIPNPQFAGIVISTFQSLIGQQENPTIFDFGSSSYFSKLFTALMLIRTAIQRSANLIIDFIPAFANFCVDCFEVNHPAVQSIASFVFVDHITLFLRHIFPRVPDMIMLILSRIIKNRFNSGHTVIHTILYELPMDVCDQVAQPIYAGCVEMLKLCSNENVPPDVIFDLWINLADMIRNVSSEVGLSFFDELFPQAIGIIQSFYDEQLKRQSCKMEMLENETMSPIIELIGSFSVSCSSKLEVHFDNVTLLLLNLLQLQVENYFRAAINDLMVIRSILNVFSLFVKNMNGFVTPHIDNILILVFRYSKIKIFKIDSDSDEKDEFYVPLINDEYTYEMKYHKKKKFAEMFTSPSISLLTAIFAENPEKFHSGELISKVLSIGLRSMDDFFKCVNLKGVELLNQFILFQYNMSRIPEFSDFLNYKENIKSLIPFIDRKLRDEITEFFLKDDYELFLSYLDLIKTIYVHFKFDVFCIEDPSGNKKFVALELLDLLLSIAERSIQYDSLCYIDSLHDSIEDVINAFIKYYNHPDKSVFAPFVPRFLRFFEEDNVNFQTFSISILGNLVQYYSITDNETMHQIYLKSVERLTEYDPAFSRYFAIFLSNLRLNYPEFLAENQDNLVQMIDSIIARTEQSDLGRSLVECLIALFAAVDRSVGMTNSHFLCIDRFNWFFSFLPIQNTQEENNQIVFAYLLTHFSQFPQDLKMRTLKIFCNVLTSPATIKESFLLSDIIFVLFQIIMNSKIMENRQVLEIIFDGNQESIQSFYETIQHLANLSQRKKI